MNDLKHLQIKHKNYINIESPEEIKKQINNQQEICYICCDTLTLNSQEKDEVVIKTKCNHFYHYECLLTSIKNKPSYYSNNRQECPYCRSSIGWLPLLTENQIPVKYAHKEYFNNKLKDTILCQAIIQSGKKKGQLCGCKVKIFGSKCCGRHKNYKFPEITEKDKSTQEIEIENYKNTWFLGKTLNCY